MKTMVKMLKVKVKSLAEEARIIRLEERRAKKDDRLREALHLHRVNDVRKEQRSSLLAYAFIRGLPRQAVERTGKPVDWGRVEKMVEKFGVTDRCGDEWKSQGGRFKAWKVEVPVTS